MSAEKGCFDLALARNALKVYRQWVPCEYNSSYSFIPSFLKLCRSFHHGIRICM